MPVISTDRDVEALTLTFVAEFDATVERVWQLWKDPRQLERWWGPPTWPATFDELDFVVDGKARYYMTGPGGDRAHGWWTITAIDEPSRFEFDDGFADADGNPVTPIDSAHGVVTLDPVGDGTRMTVVSYFDSPEQLERMVNLGMEEGMGLALGQIDGILSEV
ncbi:SRPBCC domain-containing protein [Glaciihabitans sp. UYNi722]|uniref:SRPBCC family protein n=1 Tax=Glaciihabitans sp. UYNi722 TaxID=3156344 RepID=UPI00339B140C